MTDEDRDGESDGEAEPTPGEGEADAEGATSDTEAVEETQGDAFDDALEGGFDELLEGEEDAGEGEESPIEAEPVDEERTSGEASSQDAEPESSSSLDRSPFEELEGRETEEDLDAIFEEAFTDESVADTEEIWEELADFEGLDQGSREEHVVPKRSFCEQCPHLTDPPEFRCTHEGTDIVEFVDNDHVRVRACPIVEERRGIEIE